MTIEEQNGERNAQLKRIADLLQDSVELQALAIETQLSTFKGVLKMEDRPYLRTNVKRIIREMTERELMR